MADLTLKELEEFLSALKSDPIVDSKSVQDQLTLSELTPEDLDEFKKTVLTPGSVPEVNEAGDVLQREPADLVDIGKSIGGGAVELGKQFVTNPRVSAPALATMAGGPQAGLATAAVTPLAMEIAELIAAGEPTNFKDKLTEQILSNTPVGFLTFGSRIERAIKTDPDFFPPFTEDEKTLIQTGSPALARLSQISRGKGSDIVKRSAISGTIDASIELLGIGIGKAISLGARGGFAKVTPEAAEAMKVLAPIGGQLNVAQLTDSAVFDFMDRISRAGIFSRTAADAFDVQNDALIRSAISDLNSEMVTRIGRDLTRAEITGILQTGFDVGNVARKAMERQMFQSTFKLAEDLGVSVSKFDFIKARTKLNQLFKKRGGINIPAKVKTELKKFDSLPPQVDFESAHHIRSAFKEMAIEASEKGEKTLAKFSGQIADDLTSAMEKSAKEVPELFPTWRKAQRFFKIDKKVFEDDFTAKLFIHNKKAAEAVGEAIYDNGHVTNIKKTKEWLRRAEAIAKKGAREGLVDPVTNQAVKEFDRKQVEDAIKFGYMRKFFKKHFVPSQTSPLPEITAIPGQEARRGFIDWDGMLRDLGDPTEKTKETMQLLFGKEHYAKMVDYAKAGQFFAAKSPGSTGAWQLMQMSAAASIPKGVGGIISGSAIGPGTKTLGAGLSVLALPDLFGWIMRNPKSIKYITDGTKFMSKQAIERTGKGIGAAISSLGRAIATSREEAGNRINPFMQSINELPPEETPVDNTPKGFNPELQKINDSIAQRRREGVAR